MRIKGLRIKLSRLRIHRFISHLNFYFLDASASKTHVPAAIDNNTGLALDLDEKVIKKFNCLPKRLPEFCHKWSMGMKAFSGVSRGVLRVLKHPPNLKKMN